MCTLGTVFVWVFAYVWGVFEYVCVYFRGVRGGRGGKVIKRKSSCVDVRTGCLQRCGPQHQLVSCPMTDSCYGGLKWAR